MGVITNGSGGGAGGGIRYNAQTDMIQVKVNGTWVDTPYKAYGTFDGTLYDAGVMAVPWDNTGYAYAVQYPCVGSATIGASTISFTTTSMYASTSKGIITDDVIDMSQWNSLHIMYNGSHIILDVSSVNDNCYVALGLLCDVNSTFMLRAFVTRAKVNYGAGVNWVTFSDIASGSANVTGNFTKIWLE